jgi:hypothetical protein
MGAMLVANYNGFSQSNADVMLLLSGMQCRFTKRDARARRKHCFALREPGKHGRPSCFNRPLKVNRLHANHRQRAVTRKQASRTRTSGELGMFFQYAAQPYLFRALEVCECDELTVENLIAFGAQDVGETSGHAGAEIETHRAENQDDTASHVFATVLADSLDNGEGTAVANGEAFTRPACDKELAGCGAV